MEQLRLRVISLRYSSWSMRPWLLLQHVGAQFETETVELELGHLKPAVVDDQVAAQAKTELVKRRGLGSITGLFPVLYVNDVPIHESIAIAEWINEAFPAEQLLPADRLQRAQARAISAEMASNFTQLRSYLSCHLFGRVPNFQPTAGTQHEIARVFELWEAALDRSGGPFLFGRFGIPDAMYFPVRTRFRTYGVAIPERLAPYVAALDALPAVKALEVLARDAPRIPAYDDYLRSLGGTP